MTNVPVPVAGGLPANTQNTHTLGQKTTLFIVSLCKTQCSTVGLGAHHSVGMWAVMIRADVKRAIIHCSCSKTGCTHDYPKVNFPINDFHSAVSKYFMPKCKSKSRGDSSENLQMAINISILLSSIQLTWKSPDKTKRRVIPMSEEHESQRLMFWKRALWLGTQPASVFLRDYTLLKDAGLKRSVAALYYCSLFHHD